MMKPSSFLLCALFTLPVAGVGVRAAAAPPAAAGAKAVGDDPAVPRLAVGAKAKCPVTGEEFTVKANTVQVTYGGKRYGFCCPECQPTFAKNPAKYAL